jgi:hypothetical protein
MSKKFNQRKFCVGMNIVFFLLRMNSYDQTISGSLEPTEKNENRPKFETTMKFVEDYLKTVVEQPNSFSDREQNKLTHEVIFIIRKKIFYLLFDSSRLLI